MLPVRRCDVYQPHAGFEARNVAEGHRQASSLAGRGASWVGNRLNRKRNAVADVERAMMRDARPIALCLNRRSMVEAAADFPDLPPDRLVPFPNGVDLDRFDRAAVEGGPVRRRYNLVPDVPLLLIVAQDFARKGLTPTIEALATLPEPRPTLLVVGRDNPGPYRARAERRGVAGQVIFAGPIEDVRPFYAAADAFVMPTRHDPCSLVVLEALAMGVPVVSTAANGACDLMADGTHGRVLADPDDVAALAAAIADVLAHRPEMSAACLALRPTLGFDARLDALEAIYQRVADERRRRGER